MIGSSGERSGRGDRARFVIAISGRIGAGKASLAAALADQLDATHVSFGIEVRRVVTELGLDSTDIDKLQAVGQALVITDCGGLVERTLAQDTGDSCARLVVAGLRHVEALLELRKRFQHVWVVYVDTPEEQRAERLIQREGIERRLSARYDNALCEAQSSRIMPQYANVVVDGTLPVGLQVATVVSRLALTEANSRTAAA